MDVAKLTPKFWKLHRDPILPLDAAATTLLSIQFNLCLGTISAYLRERHDLLQLATSLLEYRTM